LFDGEANTQYPFNSDEVSAHRSQMHSSQALPHSHESLHQTGQDGSIHGICVEQLCKDRRRQHSRLGSIRAWSGQLVRVGHSELVQRQWVACLAVRHVGQHRLSLLDE